MSMEIDVVRCDISVKVGHLGKCLQALYDEVESIQRHLGDDWKMPANKNKRLTILNDVLEDFSLCATENKPKRIIQFEYDSENWHDEVAEAFHAIAEFVKQGSRIIFYSEGDIWSYAFFDDDCSEQSVRSFMWENSPGGSVGNKKLRNNSLDINLSTEDGVLLASEVAESYSK